MTWLFLGLYFAGWLLIPHLLLLKKRPAATLAWLWAIIFIPIVGAASYVAIGTDRLKRRRLKRRNYARTPRLGTTIPGDAATASVLQRLPRRDQQFLQLLSRINELPASSADCLRILRNSDEFYPALASRIREARHHIHIEFYIWHGDETGERFLELLTAAAQRGVTVRLLLDGVGSHRFSEWLLADYRAAGGHFSWFQSLDPLRNRFFLNLRNHRKLQIIDGEIAFVGGMNIGREYEGKDPELGHWRDVQLEIAGPVLATLQEVFIDDWYFATDQKISGPAYFPVRDLPAVHPVHVITGGPDRRNEPMSKSIVSLINEASTRVWIATGYFVPDDVLLASLELAASRGIDVRLLISEKNDHPLLVIVGRSYYGELLAAGVRLFEYSAGINHAKIAVVDDHWSMVGSANLDYRSMRLNFELNLLFQSPEQTEELAQILAHDFALCQEIQSDVFGRRPMTQKFSEAALRPLSPLL